MLPAIVGILLFPAHADAKKVHWHTGGATTFGGPGDASSGSTGYRGDDLNSAWKSYAELGNGCALGCLPYGAKLRILIPSTHKRLTLLKRDIGFGGGPIAGFPRVIDLWHAAAAALGVGHVWSGKVLYRRVG